MCGAKRGLQHDLEKFGVDFRMKSNKKEKLIWNKDCNYDDTTCSTAPIDTHTHAHIQQSKIGSNDFWITDNKQMKNR